MPDPISTADNIRKIVSDSSAFFKTEVEKLLTSLSTELEKLHQIAIDYQTKLNKSKSEWQVVKNEVDRLKSQQEELVARGKEVDDKIVKLNKDSEDLAEMHKILNNRKKVLDAREAEIADKERRSKMI